MKPKQLAQDLVALLDEITPSDWYVSDGVYTLSVRSVRPSMEDEKARYRKPVRNICVLAACGIRKTAQKRANANFICLIKNNLPLIIAALHSQK